MADGGRVVKEEALNTLKVAHRPGQVRKAQVRRVRPKERELLVQAGHQPAKGVEQEAGMLHCLLAALVLGHGQRNAEQPTEVGPPRVLRLGLGQSCVVA
jgi:hypothetical protein